MFTKPDGGPGRRLQIGGGMSALIGVAWLIMVPSAPPGAVVDPHKPGLAFLVVGVFCVVVGTVDRWLYLK